MKEGETVDEVGVARDNDTYNHVNWMTCQNLGMGTN
jgi:hypothetical protein